MRLIDADALKEMAVSLSDGVFNIDAIPVGEIDNAETIDPVKHGHWVLEAAGIDIIPRTRCSVCNAACARWVPYYYCPECGSMMDEGMRK